MTKKSVFITGAAKRIGRHLSLYFASKGYDLVLHYNKSSQSMDDLLKKISSSCRVSVIQADFSKSEDIKKTCEKIFDISPHLNLMISNASLYEPHNLKTMTEEEFDNNISVNLKAPMFLTQTFAQKYRSKNACIINILDTNIIRDSFDYFSYSLAKKALGHATKMSALEYAPDLRINGIALGYFLNSHKKHEQVVRRIPLQRQGLLKEIEMTAQFIIDNTFLTGEIIFCDGGKHLCS